LDATRLTNGKLSRKEKHKKTIALPRKEHHLTSTHHEIQTIKSAGKSATSRNDWGKKINNTFGKSGSNLG
jgi:hypothetical protein